MTEQRILCKDEELVLDCTTMKLVKASEFREKFRLSLKEKSSAYQLAYRTSKKAEIPPEILAEKAQKRERLEAETLRKQTKRALRQQLKERQKQEKLRLQIERELRQAERARRREELELRKQDRAKRREERLKKQAEQQQRQQTRLEKLLAKQQEIAKKQEEKQKRRIEWQLRQAGVAKRKEERLRKKAEKESERTRKREERLKNKLTPVQIKQRHKERLIAQKQIMVECVKTALATHPCFGTWKSGAQPLKNECWLCSLQIRCRILSKRLRYSGIYDCPKCGAENPVALVFSQHQIGTIARLKCVQCGDLGETVEFSVLYSKTVRMKLVFEMSRCVNAVFLQKLNTSSKGTEDSPFFVPKTCFECRNRCHSQCFKNLAKNVENPIFRRVM